MQNFKDNIQKLPNKDILQSAKILITDFIGDSENVKSQKNLVDDKKKDIDSKTSDRIINYIVEEYRNNINDAQEKLTSSAEAHWKQNEKAYREEMIKLVTGSDALSKEHKEQLSKVIMDYQELEFDDEADKVFVKERFLKGNILGLRFFESERINLTKLTFIYNFKMKSSISELADEINNNCFQSFKSMQERLKDEIEKNIAEYNPELNELSELIKEESDKIHDLKEKEAEISKAIKSIQSNMEWKTVEY